MILINSFPRTLEKTRVQSRLIKLFQAQENVDPSWVRVWLLDMSLAGDGKVAVLMAAHNPNISTQLHYAIGKHYLQCSTDAII